MSFDSPAAQPARIRSGIEDFDLTPNGLADTPAQQMDSESLVHTGNS